MKATSSSDLTVTMELETTMLKVNLILKDDWGTKIRNNDADLGDLINKGVGAPFQGFVFVWGQPRSWNRSTSIEIMTLIKVAR